MSNTYSPAYPIMCPNCRWNDGYPWNTNPQIPLGQKIEDTPCPNCGIKGLKERV